MAKAKTEAARLREEERIKQRWTANLSIPTVARAGVSKTTLDIEREALDYCKGKGHRLRDRGKAACRDCLQRALMGRLHEQRKELPPLPSSINDPVAVHIDELLRSGGRWSLATLLDRVNERRAGRRNPRTGEPLRPYTETACSARIRDLRGAGRSIHQAVLPEGGAEYWMDV